MANHYVLLLRDSGQHKGLSPEEIQSIIGKYKAWSDRMRAEGIVVGGKKLADGAGRVLRGDHGKPVVSDGPYVEAREVLGGLFEIVADSYDAAVEIAKGCPHMENGSSIEIRAIEIG
jgi:hypothetical protein